MKRQFDSTAKKVVLQCFCGEYRACQGLKKTWPSTES